MKKMLIAFFAAGMAVAGFAAPGDGVTIELDGRPHKNEFTQLSAPGMQVKSTAKTDTKGEFHFLIGDSKDLTDKWQTYTVSFVPVNKAFIFGLRAWRSNVWIDYDDIKVENAEVYNPSFEVVNGDKEIDGWRYYNPATLKVDQADAAEGKNYITCSGRYGIRKSIPVVPGKKVTISFKARLGKPLPPPEKPNWTSNGNRKVF